MLRLSSGLLALGILTFLTNSFVQGQTFNTKLISNLSDIPVVVPGYGEPELMAAISNRSVVIASNKYPGTVARLDFGVNPVNVAVKSRPSGAPNYDGTGQDTQVVRLRDGQFLLSGPGSVVLSKSSAEVFWRSDKGLTWSSPTALDSDVVSALNTNGVSAKGYCSELKPGKGGFDRPELYAYPFSVPSGGTLAFLTTLCMRNDDIPVVLFRSTDGGKTWDDSTIRLSGYTPAAMTASPKHLFIAQCVDTSVYISSSDDRGKTLTAPDPAQPGKLQLDATPEGRPCVMYDDPGAHGNKWSISVVRTKDPDVVLVAYPSIEEHVSTTAKGFKIVKKRRVIQIISANVKNHTAAAVKTIRASNEDGSILHFSFIEDPRPDPAGDLASLLYWVETDGANPTLPPKPWNADVAAKWPTKAFAAHTKYSLMVGNGYFTAPVELSNGGWDVKYPQLTKEHVQLRPNVCGATYDFVSSGWPGCAEQWVGDYMKGGSAVFGNQIDFAAVWPQCPSGNCNHYAQVVSVDVSKPLSAGPTAALIWKTATPIKAQKIDATKLGPILEPHLPK